MDRWNSNIVQNRKYVYYPNKKKKQHVSGILEGRVDVLVGSSRVVVSSRRQRNQRRISDAHQNWCSKRGLASRKEEMEMDRDESA